MDFLKCRIVILSILLCLVCNSYGAKITRYLDYKSSVSSDVNGALDLKAELNYDSGKTNCPIVVVMHGYSPTATFPDVKANAQRLRDTGFFAVSVAMRGRDGSDGIRDSGGVEIYDIYDAVEAVKAAYPQYVNPDNISITGYSGGGGNAMLALVRFPDYFRAGSSYFGMSDYGYNTVSGWFFFGASSSHQAQLIADIGDPRSANPVILDRYMARCANLASHNNPYSEIHLFVNNNESICPPVNHGLYRTNASAHETVAGQFNNIHEHIGGYGLYEDFNNNGLNESGELQNWPHGFPTADQQNAAEGWYRQRLLDGQIPQPHLNLSDDLFVPGFVKTKLFSLWLGDGQNAAGNLNYSLSDSKKLFSLTLLTSSKTIVGVLKIKTTDMQGKQIFVKSNGTLIQTLTAQQEFVYSCLKEGETLEITTIPDVSILGDFDKDDDVDMDDLSVLSKNWYKNVNYSEDTNFDGIINELDFFAVCGNWFYGRPHIVYSFDLDINPCWQTEGQWTFGIPQGLGGDFHGYPDPAGGSSGKKVYGVNLCGDYVVSVSTPYYLTAGPFDFSDHKKVKLKFMRWLNCDENGYVSCRIELFDGCAWQKIWENSDFVTDNSWIPVEYDISGLADRKSGVYIRWSYQVQHIRAWAFSGWNIDDILLLGIPAH